MLTLTRESNTITREATDLTHQSLALAHPPKLAAVGFHIHGGFLSAFETGKTLGGSFSLINVGRTETNVAQIFVTLIFAQRLPEMRPYDGTAALWTEINKTLRPGESISYQFQKDDGAITEQEHLEMIGQLDRSRFVFVFGSLKYTDSLNPPTHRQMTFCRRFDPDRRRFEVCDDPDYQGEY